MPCAEVETLLCMVPRDVFGRTQPRATWFLIRSIWAELALFDTLTKPPVETSEAEERKVKDVARELLDSLKGGRLVLDWRKRQQTRAAVRVCIQDQLAHLPTIYADDLYGQKCALVYEHVYDGYRGAGESLYTEHRQGILQ